MNILRFILVMRFVFIRYAICHNRYNEGLRHFAFGIKACDNETNNKTDNHYRRLNVYRPEEWILEACAQKVFCK